MGAIVQQKMVVPLIVRNKGGSVKFYILPVHSEGEAKGGVTYHYMKGGIKYLSDEPIEEH